MQTKNRNTYTTIHTEGALLPIDLLQRISDNDPSLPGLTPEGYHLAPGEKINEAINRSWNRLSGLWTAFQNALQKLPPSDYATTLTRERWLLPLFQELGYGRLSTARAVEIEGKSYAISHRWEKVPIHLVGANLKLDRATPGAAGAARTNPHSLLQEYLNRTPGVQWGILSNGFSLRVLRDNATLTRQAYLEFELESLFNGEVYADFALLWLVCHQSRFETSEKQSECMLEGWSKNAQEGGTRALEALREGVEKAIITLGQGFLQHRQNSELRGRLKSGELSAQDYYRQLLRLVYRLIFLFTAEDRELLLLPEATLEAKERFENFYSTTRLRQLADRQRGSRHHDRYESLRLVMNLLGSTTGCSQLALPALGGFLFDPSSAADINNAKLDNHSLFTAVRWLASIREGNTRRIVDYRNLGPEELGSVYESLLELHPLLNTDAGTFDLSSAAGNERKTTGSYYTHTSLIKVLLDSALNPVIEDRVRASGRSPSEQEAALLDLNVCDPACGSGHFLIAVAHRITNKLAQVRGRGDEPSPEETRHALRDVIRHCIYGVDLNPMAVELCKVNLWLESIEPGKPLSFLDSHIKCGNSLVGVGPKMDLDSLEIPDDTFKAVTGDHMPTAALLRKRNKQEREGQESLFVTELKTQEDLEAWLAQRAQAIEDMPEDDAAQVHAKTRAFEEINQSEQYLKQRQIADLWTAAFFWKIEEPDKDELSILAPTHGQLQRLLNGRKVQEGLLIKVNDLSIDQGYFHWQLEFADVHTRGGFDSVFGNPPWEKINLKDEEYFAYSHPDIANAPTKAIRKKLISKLEEDYRSDYQEYINAQAYHDNLSNFFRISKTFPLTGISRINLYSIFTERSLNILSPNGILGLVIASGIATDDNNRFLFEKVVESGRLISIFDFENRENFFPGIDSRYKFCIFCVGGTSSKHNEPDFAFFLSNIQEIYNPVKHFNLSHIDLCKINPTTRTCPTFKNRIDAEIVKQIYDRIPAWCVQNEEAEEIGIPKTPFNMSNDSGLFQTSSNLFLKGGVVDKNGCIVVGDKIFIPLYESKFIHQFNHRYASFNNSNNGKATDDNAIEFTEEELRNPLKFINSRYWLEITIQEERFPGNWFLAYRMITNSTNERGSIATIIPKRPCGNSITIITNLSPITSTLVCANMNSFVFDFVARLKIPGMNFNHWILKQLPFFPSSYYKQIDIDFIATRAIELIYTAYDLKPFAEELNYFNNPFIWDENRRLILRAELDAYYAALYGLTRDELRYILDPQDVYGPDFPGETFRVLKEKEIRQYGEYRTRRLVLEAWDRLAASGELPVGRDFTHESSPEILQPTPAIPLTSQNPPAAPRETKVSPPKPKPQPGPAPLLDFAAANPQVEEEQLAYGFYKCSLCGALKMHFDVKEHEVKEHAGKTVEWKKIG